MSSKNENLILNLAYPLRNSHVTQSCWEPLHYSMAHKQYYLLNSGWFYNQTSLSNKTIF